MIIYWLNTLGTFVNSCFRSTFLKCPIFSINNFNVLKEWFCLSIFVVHFNFNSIVLSLRTPDIFQHVKSFLYFPFLLLCVSLFLFEKSPNNFLIFIYNLPAPKLCFGGRLRELGEGESTHPFSSIQLLLNIDGKYKFCVKLGKCTKTLQNIFMFNFAAVIIST